MSSIAKYLVQQNIDVAGYDQRKSFITNQLNQDGIRVDFNLRAKENFTVELNQATKELSLKVNGVVRNEVELTHAAEKFEELLNIIKNEFIKMRDNNGRVKN